MNIIYPIIFIFILAFAYKLLKNIKLYQTIEDINLKTNIIKENFNTELDKEDVKDLKDELDNYGFLPYNIVHNTDYMLEPPPLLLDFEKYKKQKKTVGNTYAMKDILDPLPNIGIINKLTSEYHHNNLIIDYLKM
jgi:hypothetical protein